MLHSIRSLLTIAMLLVPLTAAAQAVEETTALVATADADEAVETTALADSTNDAVLALPIVDKSSFGFAAPNFLLSAPGFYGFSPYSYYNMGNSWQLHEGFNAQVSMSLSAAFGHHAPHGVGFGQSAAFAYAIPLSDRFAVAVGVYADNMTWGGRQATDGGVAAAVRYRLTDAINLYGYATKSFISDEARRNSLFPYYPPQLGDRIGAMAEFKIGEKAMIQVSVEQARH